MSERRIYADHAATTAVSDEVLQEILPYFQEHFGNPSSIYGRGRENERAIIDARKRVANVLGAQPNEIFFTAGGSESDNWAIKGVADKLSEKGKKHIITSAFEHHAVLHTCEFLEKHGFEITYLPVSPEGLIDPQQAEDAIREDTALVTIMYANNEIGTIQPIPEIGAICKKKGVLFHTDAVQAIGNVPINVKALELATADIPGKIAKLTPLRDKLIDGILKIDQTRLNGDRNRRLAGNVNVSIVGIEGESLLLLLDQYGIQASSGSACTSGSLDPSHVLLSLGLAHEVAHGSLRLSFGEEFTEEDADYILEVIPQIVDRLRSMSPMWESLTQSGKRLV